MESRTRDKSTEAGFENIDTIGQVFPQNSWIILSFCSVLDFLFDVKLINQIHRLSTHLNIHNFPITKLCCSGEGNCGTIEGILFKKLEDRSCSKLPAFTSYGFA
jgi:hypothetical protein